MGTDQEASSLLARRQQRRATSLSSKPPGYSKWSELEYPTEVIVAWLLQSN